MKNTKKCIIYHVSALALRVFLRAINTYAVTMNQKFLNNDDFEVQVSELCFLQSFFLAPVLFCLYHLQAF